MKKTATAFTTERRHLLEIIDGLIEGIILLDQDRRIVWANDTALAMHGVTSRWRRSVVNAVAVFFIAGEVKKWGEAVKQSGAQVD